MLSKSVLTDLVSRHVLAEGESLQSVDDQVNPTTVTTNYREFDVTYELDEWAIGREEWISDVVVASRTDVHVHGRPERFVFLVPTGAEEIYVNDVDAVAALGARLRDGMDPVGYAELLVQLHPYTSAIRDLLLDEDDLRRIFALDDLPDAETLVLDDSEAELELTFQSCTRYRRPGTMALLDIYDWTVTVPESGPVTWTSELTAEALPLA